MMRSLYLPDKYFAALLMLSFFLPLRVQVFILIPVCVFFGIRDLLLIREEENKKRLLQAVLLGSLYLLYLAYVPFTKGQHLSYLLFNLEQKASLLLIPVIFACFSERTRNVLMGQLPVFALGCVLSCLAGNLVFLYHHFLSPAIADGMAPGHVVYRRGFEAVTGIHPTYMGLYLCFSTAVLLFHEEVKNRVGNRGFTAALMLLFLFMLALLPKTPLIALFFVLGYYGWVHRRNRSRWLVPVIAMALSLLIAYLAIPSTEERVLEMKGLFAEKDARNPIENSVNMRQVIWSVDTHLLRQHWLTGVGPGQMKYALAEQYWAYSALLKTPLSFYDTHNEYFNIWISFGVIGIALLLFILAYQLFRAIKTRRHLHLVLMAMVMICFTTENILGTQRGITFYTFFTALFFFTACSVPKKESACAAVKNK